jgi:hypothetical protein
LVELHDVDMQSELFWHVLPAAATHMFCGMKVLNPKLQIPVLQSELDVQ